MPSLTYIVPTCGRSTLRATLLSILPQLDSADELLCVGDGEQPTARALCEELAHARLRYFEHGPTRRWGNAQRIFAIGRVTTSHVAYMDDDDEAATNAVAIIRSHAMDDRPVIFRMKYDDGRVLWSEPVLRPGNVGTPMIVHPRERHGTWTDVYEGDYHFIHSTVKAYGGLVAFHPGVVAKIHNPVGQRVPDECVRQDEQERIRVLKQLGFRMRDEDRRFVWFIPPQDGSLHVENVRSNGMVFFAVEPGNQHMRKVGAFLHRRPDYKVERSEPGGMLLSSIIQRK